MAQHPTSSPQQAAKAAPSSTQPIEVPEIPVGDVDADRRAFLINTTTALGVAGAACVAFAGRSAAGESAS